MFFGVWLYLCSGAGSGKLLAEPRVMGDRTGLHPVVIIASVFFWGLAFDGVLGMILGIPLTAFLTVCWRLLRKKYLPNRTSKPDLYPIEKQGSKRLCARLP